MPQTATRKPATAAAKRAAAKKAAPAKKAAAKAAPAKPQAKKQADPKPSAAKWDKKVLARVVALRADELSWAKIAAELNLGSPGTARRAWREATGHTGTLPRLAGRGGRVVSE